MGLSGPLFLNPKTMKDNPKKIIKEREIEEKLDELETPSPSGEDYTRPSRRARREVGSLGESPSGSDRPSEREGRSNTR
jgi:hypothetical protein